MLWFNSVLISFVFAYGKLCTILRKQLTDYQAFVRGRGKRRVKEKGREKREEKGLTQSHIDS